MSYLIKSLKPISGPQDGSTNYPPKSDVWGTKKEGLILDITENDIYAYRYENIGPELE
jgi:hypothetical protein